MTLPKLQAKQVQISINKACTQVVTLNKVTVENPLCQRLKSASQTIMKVHNADYY
jgi:D-alanyl-D-alanine dipeptidase